MKETEQMDGIAFNCNDCGADLTYSPGTRNIDCQYCGAKNEIEDAGQEIKEQDFHEQLSATTESEHLPNKFVDCSACGASSSIESQITAASCPYCAAPFVIENAYDANIILPKSLIPFQLKKEEAQKEFKQWIGKSWFVPNDLKKAQLNFERFKGVYIPYWTYDANYDTSYTGLRGDHYYVTETVRIGDKTVTRQVQKTRWTPASGSVNGFHDDLLVIASTSLPDKYAHKLEPWDLSKLTSYDEKFLSGFTVERYRIKLEEGFELAKEIGKPAIKSNVRQDIGGDVQTITTMNTEYTNIKFKHLLLPIFVCAYKFKGESYQFLINGQTGEVQGERPRSWIKITLAILIGLAIIGGLIWAYLHFNQ